MNIDQQAPLKARKEILIEVPANKVWSLLTDINHWPEWQSAVAYAEIQGNLAVGTAFRWKAMGLNISSVIRELEPEKAIVWTGKSLGMTAIHQWKLEPVGDDTRVITTESLSGWFPKMLKLLSPAFLDKSLDNSLLVLKSKAERMGDKVL